MIPLEIPKGIRQPNHVDIVVHDAVPQLQDLQEMPRPPRREVKETLAEGDKLKVNRQASRKNWGNWAADLGSELVGGLGVGGGRDEDSVAGPALVDGVEGGVVLGDDEGLVGAALAGEADEPVAEKREVGVADGAEDEGAVAGDGGGGVGQGVVAPAGEGWVGIAGGGAEEGGGGEEGPGEEDADEEEEGEEGEEREGGSGGEEE